MHIRAGLVYPLAKKKYSKDSYRGIVREIIYWSGWCDDNKFYYDMYYIGIILNSDLCYPAPFDFDLSVYYPGYEQKILNIFAEWDCQDIFDAISYYIYHYQLVLAEEMVRVIPLNPTLCWLETKGKNYEVTVKFILNQVYGFDIGVIDRKDYKIPGTDVTLVGKADGIIVSSPGGVYDKHVLECKYARNKCNIEKNRTQIACYYKIYGLPVLLVIFQDNVIKTYRYGEYSLAQTWNENVGSLLTACDEIRRVAKLENTESVPEAIELLAG